VQTVRVHAQGGGHTWAGSRAQCWCAMRGVAQNILSTRMNPPRCCCATHQRAAVFEVWTGWISVA
jgi:hypothetical protein